MKKGTLTLDSETKAGGISLWGRLNYDIFRRVCSGCEEQFVGSGGGTGARRRGTYDQNYYELIAKWEFFLFISEIKNALPCIQAPDSYTVPLERAVMKPSSMHIEETRYEVKYLLIPYNNSLAMDEIRRICEAVEIVGNRTAQLENPKENGAMQPITFGTVGLLFAFLAILEISRL